ncbi:DMT family transporter [Streptacidiphilus rugosus]|uniref:DMT family transporter n=1 Tax=Streptacidiphilus rugosus TaxID=405783 RepID=UPI000A9A7F3C|nr:DMT family transporter [Streptacidiphilus rugosus]
MTTERIETRVSPSSDSPSSARSARLAAGAAGLTVVLWASAFVGIRSAGHDLSPGALALLRLAVATLLLGGMVVARREPLPSRRDLPRIIAVGLLWFGAYNVMLNAAEQRVDAGTASMLVNISPILIALIAAAVLREGLTKALVLGMLVSFSGVLVIGFGSSRHGGTDYLGVLLCFASAVVYAVAVVVQKPVLTQVSALQTTFLACAVGTVACLPFAPQLLHEIPRAHSSAIAWAVYLGAAPTAVAFTTWAYALARTSAGKLGVTTYLVPPISILLGWLMLSETPSWVSVGGGLLCLGGVAVARFTRKPDAARPAQSGSSLGR